MVWVTLTLNHCYYLLTEAILLKQGQALDTHSWTPACGNNSGQVIAWLPFQLGEFQVKHKFQKIYIFQGGLKFFFSEFKIFESVWQVLDHPINKIYTRKIIKTQYKNETKKKIYSTTNNWKNKANRHTVIIFGSCISTWQVWFHPPIKDKRKKLNVHRSSKS